MWFEIKDDKRITERCASEGCGGQVMYRLEADGVGSYFCSGCRVKIEVREDARLYGSGFTLEKPDGSIERIPPERIMLLPDSQD